MATEPKIVLMPEHDRAEAVAVLARWLTELFNDDGFRAKSKTRLAGVKVTVGKVRAPARPLLLQKKNVSTGQSTCRS
jgi:hypothetical protein